MERRMWAVSSGAYSDYSVRCLLESEEEAERLAARINGIDSSFDGARVESFPIVTADIERVEMLYIHALIADDGTAETPYERYDMIWAFDPDYAPDEVRWSWLRHARSPKGGALRVEGSNHERVRKVFSEQRAVLMSDPAYRAEQYRGSE